MDDHRRDEPGSSATSRAAALALVREGMAQLRAAGVAATDGEEANAIQRELEAVHREVVAVQTRAVEDLRTNGWFVRDAHANAKVAVRHLCRVSGTEAHRRVQRATALRSLRSVQAAFDRGAISVDHLDRIVAAFANPRVRARVAEAEEEFVARACRTSYADFAAWVADWVRREDEDGTCDRSRRTHENRDVRLSQGFDDGWHLEGRFGTLQGAELHAIWERWCQAEFEADWAEARERLGDAATGADLARTPAQRRADAWAQLTRKGADAWAAAPGGSAIHVVVTVDHATFERRIAAIFGRPSGAVAPAEPDAFRCETLDGFRIDPTEATFAALLGTVRRAVYGADGVILDLGRSVRLFAGLRQLAVRLSGRHCGFPGCEVPASQCQSDHLVGFNGPGKGRTSPENGAPTCGRHNRMKEQGFTVRRDPDGTLAVHRPDGTRIE